MLSLFKNNISATIRSNFFRNIFMLMSGTALAQVLPLLATPFITRFYSPQTYGTYAIYISITSILTIIASGRYQLAIVLPKKNSNAIQLLYACIALSLLTSSFIFIISLFFSNFFLNLFHLDNIF